MVLEMVNLTIYCLKRRAQDLQFYFIFPLSPTLPINILGSETKEINPLKNFILTCNIYPNFRLQCLSVSSTSNDEQINLIVFTVQCFTAVHKMRPITKMLMQKKNNKQTKNVNTQHMSFYV